MDMAVLHQLMLARTRGVGPVTYRQLLARFGTAQAALSALPDLVRRGGGAAYKPLQEDRILREIADVRALGARHLFAGDPEFPPMLAQLAGAPVVLIAMGDGSLMRKPAVAIVGARNASAAACAFARQLAHDLGNAGRTIVSGLARGIDSAAHRGALDSGTIAVIGNGHDMTFPPQNASLQDQIGQDHLLLSEYPPGTEPLARHFPHRNRIIAGMCAGTIVVEAAPRSGSLLTARLAGEAGREVMAVPGSPLDPRARGCNQLIREGATLIQCADDVIEALSPMDPHMVASDRARPLIHDADADHEAADQLIDLDVTERERMAIVSLLGPVAVSIDELVRQSGLPAATIQTILLELELADRLTMHAGARASLKN